jgi:formylglycine-generating enzyme required for sulfatase activity
LIPAKQGYYILAENIPGYTFFTSPAPPFNVEIGQNLHVDLYFQRDVGSLAIEGILPASIPYLTITIYEEKVPEPIVKENLTAVNGKVQWESSVLPSDNYIILYNLPGQNIPVHSQNFVIKKNSVLTLSVPTAISQTLKAPPALSNTNPPTEKASVRVTTDTSQGIFVLTTEDGAIVEKGSGYQYTFYQVPPGSYVISFSSTNPTLIPPSSKKIVLRGKQELDVSAHYTRATPSQFQNIPQPVPAPTPSSPPTNILESKSNRAGLDIMSNLTDGRIVLEKLTEPKTQKSYYFHGKTIFIPLDVEGEFRIVFAPVPNHDTPDPILINRKKNDLTYIGVSYTLNENLLEVPAGIAIIGDPFTDKQNERESKEVNLPAFRIGTYEVTNAQFAHWLTQSFQAQKIKWNDAQPGYIWTMDGLLICRTFEATSSAQLTVQGSGNKKVVTPLIGKEHHPVIEVSWYGAQAYCKDKGYRLPTEVEWVKAAGMSLPSKTEKAKRFKYGFGQDTVDRTWANYRDGSRPIDSTQVLTTPVGFYNGTNSLPLSSEDATVAYTHNAKSPIGAYDMSGNVWEWVASENQAGSKVVKGGCYDSLAEGIRVSERLLFAPHHTDIYTGFRVAQ